MGRMHDALRKAAEERERKRRQGTRSEPEAPAAPPTAPEARDAGPAAAAPFQPATASGPAATARTTGVAEDVRAPVGERRSTYAVDQRVVAFHRPLDRRSEQFRTLRANLLAMDPRPRSILLGGGTKADDTSLTVANLAVVFAEEPGQRVLVIDANLRASTMSSLLAGPTSPGIADYLQGRRSDLGALVRPTGVPGVDILPAGDTPPNPGALIVPGMLERVLGALPGEYDHVLLDTPPLDLYADGSVLAPEADGVLLVVKLEGPSKDDAEQALESLQASRARILGDVTTNLRS